jgi:hypothetical protein
MKETTMSAHTTLMARIVPRRRARMLTACAWCERIRLGDRWVDAVRAIAHLRTYEWKRPPQFTHGICDPCLAEQLAKRKRETEPRPQAGSLYSQPSRRNENPPSLSHTICETGLEASSAVAARPPQPLVDRHDCAC